MPCRKSTRWAGHPHKPYPPARPGVRLLVVVEALTRLLEVSVAFLGGGEACLDQVLPVEGAAAHLVTVPLALGPLEGQKLDCTREGDAPSCQTP